MTSAAAPTFIFGASDSRTLAISHTVERSPTVKIGSVATTVMYWPKPILRWITVPLIGAATSRIQARGHRTIPVLLWCHGGLFAAQVALALQPGGLLVPLAWMLFGFCAAGSTPGYVIVGQMFPREQMGRVSTAANTLTLVGAFALQSVIGALLDLWPRTANGGWDPRGYSAALALSIAIQIIVVISLVRAGRR